MTAARVMTGLGRFAKRRIGKTGATRFRMVPTDLPLSEGLKHMMPFNALKS